MCKLLPVQRHPRGLIQSLLGAFELEGVYTKFETGPGIKILDSKELLIKFLTKICRVRFSSEVKNLYFVILRRLSWKGDRVADRACLENR